MSGEKLNFLITSPAYFHCAQQSKASKKVDLHALEATTFNIESSPIVVNAKLTALAAILLTSLFFHGVRELM